jgi:hypothetical protein
MKKFLLIDNISLHVDSSKWQPCLFRTISELFLQLYVFWIVPLSLVGSLGHGELSRKTIVRLNGTTKILPTLCVLQLHHQQIHFSYNVLVPAIGGNMMGTGGSSFCFLYILMIRSTSFSQYFKIRSYLSSIRVRGIFSLTYNRF